MNQKVKLPKKHGEFLIYAVTVTDKDGKVLKRITAPSKSFVEQWNKLINVQARQVTATIKDTGGTARSVATHAYNLQMNGGAGVTTYGIRIGTGTTAVAITDYALETPLAHGVGADQFSHLAVAISLPAVAGSTCSFTVSRTMINNSGATITGIRELGCYVKMAASYYGLGFRDVLGTGVDVPDGGAITVEYTIGVTV